MQSLLTREGLRWAGRTEARDPTTSGSWLGRLVGYEASEYDEPSASRSNDVVDGLNDLERRAQAQMILRRVKIVLPEFDLAVIHIKYKVSISVEDCIERQRYIDKAAKLCTMYRKHITREFAQEAVEAWSMHSKPNRGNLARETARRWWLDCADILDKAEDRAIETLRADADNRDYLQRGHK